MGERRRLVNALARSRQGVVQIPEQHVLGVWDAVGMGGDAPVEYKDLALGEEAAQVVVRTPVAEAELEHRAGHIGDQPGAQREAVALSAEAADETVKPTHEPLARPRYPALSLLSASCSWRVVTSRRCASTRMISTEISGN